VTSLNFYTDHEKLTGSHQHTGSSSVPFRSACRWQHVQILVNFYLSAFIIILLRYYVYSVSFWHWAYERRVQL